MYVWSLSLSLSLYIYIYIYKTLHTYYTMRIYKPRNTLSLFHKPFFL